MAKHHMPKQKNPLSRPQFSRQPLVVALCLAGLCSSSLYAQSDEKDPSKDIPAAAAPIAPASSASSTAQQTQSTPTTTPAGAGNSAEKSLGSVTVKDKRPVELEGRDSLQATQTKIGKGKQALRDIPQSITVLTEKFLDDRNLDTVKEALKHTAGITFLAAEGGEEDIRLRGFSLMSTGDIFVDGMRDPAFYDRDTFNLDRIEVLRGSASMLFGRGSTGGAVNQVNKTPHMLKENQLDLTYGSYQYRRAVGDFNMPLTENSALRLSTMITKADNDGAGSRLDKKGLALAYRSHIGERDEYQLSTYLLDNNNGINYGLPWIRPASAASDGASPSTTMLPADPSTYYGMASDRNRSMAQYTTLSHTHRFDGQNELTTKIRKGQYSRDLRASTIRLGSGVNLDNLNDNSVLTRGTPAKVQSLDNLYAQSDFSGNFEIGGDKHQIQAGVDYAQEFKAVYTLSGVTKASTTFGNPNDGSSVNEDGRTSTQSNVFTFKAAGVYAQDLWHLNPHWKVLAGLRYDDLTGEYQAFSGATSGNYRMKVGEWSKRLGVLFQPTDRHSYHASAATSFNTSGDAYSLGSTNQDTPPEQSVNLELGAKIESEDKNFSTRWALFHAIKFNERNTDPLSTVPGTTTPLVTLSGRRHVSGMELDWAGRLNAQWEVFTSYMWMPEAMVDSAAPCPSSGTCLQNTGGDRAGDRPSLTPLHSGSAWTTYQVDPKWRLGSGVNFRSEQTPNRNPGWYAPGWATMDLMAEFTQSSTLVWKANLTNVFNKLYGNSLYSGHYIPGAGRLLQVTASIKF